MLDRQIGWKWTILHLRCFYTTNMGVLVALKWTNFSTFRNYIERTAQHVSGDINQFYCSKLNNVK